MWREGSVTPDDSSFIRVTHSDRSAFGRALRQARTGAGYSQKALAAELDYDASYISKLESGANPPTRTFAERADEKLQQKGILVQLWRNESTGIELADETSKAARDGVTREPHAHRTGLIVIHEDSILTLAEDQYITRVRRTLYNGSDEPITRYLIRVAVDRHPNVPQVSNELYRQRPLTLGELGLAASCQGEPMAWEVQYDRDAFKEIWLRFENDEGKFPLYPGDSATIEYRYAVSAHKWGKWWQRAIRVPTERLSLEIDFPARLDPMLWGLETTLYAERLPVRPPAEVRRTSERVVYKWATAKPALHARYRFEWRFRNEPAPERTSSVPSERMRRLGIVQRGDPILVRSSLPFNLPAEADVARMTGELLIGFLDPLGALHDFGKGTGLAAPQLGIPRAAAVVRLPQGPPQVLFNPRIASASQETDDRFEGCLSFFDVRGKVRRSRAITVEHVDLDGRRRTSIFQDAAARHWQHEIDHLDGILYLDRMDDPAAELIPIEKYHGVGESWKYS